jgi:hypothetical protein
MSDSPLVLIASASPHERRVVGSSLKETGFTILAVDDAEDAGREVVSANGFSCVLVIDSGLLEVCHDSQWRDFRVRHPGLGTVLRCLIPRDSGIQRTESRTFVVHPGDLDGMQQAVRVLAVAAS